VPPSTGSPFPQTVANAFVAEQEAQGAPDSPELKNAVREELIRRELLVQEAKKMGLDKKPDVAAQADLARQAIFIRAFVQDYVKKHPISDEQVKAAYDRMKTQMGNTEYKVRHILVEKEDDAKTIIVNLKKGAKFDDLAKQSKDPGSRDKGGDLGWSSTANYVKPFGDAVGSGQGQVHRNPGEDRFRLSRDPARGQPPADPAAVRPDQAADRAAPAAGADPEIRRRTARRSRACHPNG
jgi:peptidyl-prolyl cis-trans isomerase C